MPDATIYGLEWLLLEGLPGDKYELSKGKAPCAWASPTRECAEATFEHWVETVARWRHVEARYRTDGPARLAEVGGYEFQLRSRRIDVAVPQSPGAHFEFVHNYWDPALWPGSHPEEPTFTDHQHAEHELWRPLFFAGDSEWSAYPRLTYVLGERSAVRTCCSVFRKESERWIGEPAEFLAGVPELVIEVESPATRADDRPPDGRRARVFAEAGVCHYWLADPGERCLRVFELREGAFRQTGAFRPGDRFAPAFPPGIAYDVARLFDSRFHHGPVWVAGGRPAPDHPDWCVPPTPVGVETLLLGGHPLKRYEVVDDWAPAYLAFRDEARARANYAHWANELAELAGAPRPRAVGEAFEAGPFRLRREGRRVYCDVHLPCARFRSMLETLALPNVWTEE